MLAVDRIDDTHVPGIDSAVAPAQDVLPDAHEARAGRRVDARKFARKTFDAAWPKLAALAIFVLLWQAVVWWGYKPRIIKPPREVLSTAAELWRDGIITDSILTTLVRIGWGFALSMVIGVALGAVVSS